MMKIAMRRKGLHTGASLLGATLLTAITSASGNSQQIIDKTTSNNSSDISLTNKSDAVSFNFEERWSSPAKTYVLASDGRIQAGGDSIMSQSHWERPNHIGSETAPVATAVRDNDSSNEKQQIAEQYNQYGSYSIHLGSKNRNPECGPSPLDVDQIKELVVNAARRNGVDQAFATAITWAESDFDRARNSPKGARGPMQLVPETAARFGVTDPCDPAQNIEGGVAYLRALLDEFQNPLLAAAAYNSGEQQIYTYGGVPPFPETVRYVAKVINYQIGLPMPSAKVNARPVASNANGIGSNREVGVIAVRKTGTFVGGVMHF